MTRFLIVAEKAAAPFGGTAKPFGTKPQGGADAMPEIPEEESLPEDEIVEDDEVATHEWSGDLVDPAVDEVTAPEGAFSSFTGQEGELAWLDRLDDGTLTGWVQDADGSTYRYSDVDAWAVDVDDAGMIRSDGAAAEEPVDEELDEDAMSEEDGSGAADPGVDDFLEGKQVVLRAVVRPHS